VDASMIDSEISAVRVAAGGESGRFSELLELRFRRPLIIAVGIAAVAQLSGINAVMYYSTKIFTGAGIGVADAFGATVVIGFINLLFTLVAVALMDRAGRRVLLLVGLAAQVLSLSVVALLLGMHSSGVALLIAILVFIAAFAMALGPTSWLLGSELFPAKVRGRGMSMVAFTTWVGCYAVTQTFPVLNDNPAIGPAKTFCVYAVVSLVGLLFTFLLVPETKGRTLENIEASWDMPQHDHVPSTRELRHE
jgi:SP family arabinose:H+ symporter-like MFS transporter